MSMENDLTVMSSILIPYYKGAITMEADSEYIALTVQADDGGQPMDNYPDNVKYINVTFLFDTYTGCFEGLLTASGNIKKERWYD